MPTIDPNTEGLGAFVTLDYTTIDFKTRYEHAIVLIPKNWDSMYELIRAPGSFVEMYRQAYSLTPEHKHNGVPSRVWDLKGPVTIIIEPLTVPSPANVAILNSLVNLYPGLVAATANWADRTPRQFLTDILAAVNSPAPVSWNLNGWVTESKGTSGTTDIPITKNISRFPLQYVAEFALKTRTLTIKYIPRPAPLVPTMKFSLPITLTTINPVQNTDLTFTHFDADFGNSKSIAAVADARAKFAMDFIVDPAFMNNLILDQRVIQSTAPSMATNVAASLTVTQPKATPDKSPLKYKGIGITFSSSGPTYYQSRVVIDSVWPFPDNTHVPASEAVPPLCFLVSGHYVLINGVWYIETAGILEKAYAPPTSPWNHNISQLNATISQLELLKDEIKEVGPILDASRALKAKLDKSKKQ